MYIYIYIYLYICIYIYIDILDLQRQRAPSQKAAGNIALQHSLSSEDRDQGEEALMFQSAQRSAFSPAQSTLTLQKTAV